MTENRRRWLVPGLLVAVAFVANMAVVAAVWADQTKDDNEQTEQIQAIIDARTEARFTSCDQDNRSRSVDFTQTMAQATPDALARIEAGPPEGIARALAFLRAILPQRVCTQAGIEAFYASGGTEGVVPLDLPQHVADFLARHAND